MAALRMECVIRFPPAAHYRQPFISRISYRDHLASCTERKGLFDRGKERHEYAAGHATKSEVFLLPVNIEMSQLQAIEAASATTSHGPNRSLRRHWHDHCVDCGWVVRSSWAINGDGRPARDRRPPRDLRKAATTGHSVGLGEEDKNHEDAEYEIYSIYYARNETRRRPGNFIDGDPHDVPMPMNFYVWAIVGGGEAWILDTGFDAATGATRGRTVDRAVDAGLAGDRDCTCVRQERDPEPHALGPLGNHEMFPNAAYHIQDAEMAYCTGRCMCHAVTRMPFEVTDVQAMVGRVFTGRARFHDGTAHLAPGLSTHLIGGHSKGLQCVRVNTRRGWVVLASDVAHYYAHLTERRVFPITYNVGDTLEGYRIVHELRIRRPISCPAMIRWCRNATRLHAPGWRASCGWMPIRSDAEGWRDRPGRATTAGFQEG